MFNYTWEAIHGWNVQKLVFLILWGLYVSFPLGLVEVCALSSSSPPLKCLIYPRAPGCLVMLLDPSPLNPPGGIWNMSKCLISAGGEYVKVAWPRLGLRGKEEAWLNASVCVVSVCPMSCGLTSPRLQEELQWAPDVAISPLKMLIELLRITHRKRTKSPNHLNLPSTLKQA